jgi:hypothetical protein
MTLAVPDVRIGDPLRHEALSVFPLFAETNGGVDYLLSDEALEAKSLVVEEVSESGSVPDLLVENKGDTRVLFIEGEELIGAKQNRILNTSILIAAHTKTKIPVSCVEQGRWGYKTRRFGSSGSHSPSKLRYALKSSVTRSAKAKRGHRSDQGKVWEEVERQQLAMGASSESAAMSDTFDTYQDQLAVYREKIKYVEGATGVAVAIGKKVVALDLFDKPSTCEKVWGRLLSGLVMDALEEGVSSGGAAEVGDVERLLADTGKAEWEQVDAAGEGEEFRSEFKDDHASALTFDDNLVHGSVVAAV